MNKYYLMAVSFLGTLSFKSRAGQRNILAQLDWWVGVGGKMDTRTE